MRTTRDRRRGLQLLAALCCATGASAAQGPGPDPTNCTLYENIAYYAGGSCTPGVSIPPSPPLACRPEIDESTQCLDVRVPVSVLPNSPTILYVHGGGWNGGSKSDAKSVIFLDTLCGMGYRTVSCNYTLACDDPATNHVDYPGFPFAIADVRAAIAWIRSTAAQGSPYFLSDCIVLVGVSAGGHLAAMAGALNGMTTPSQFWPSGYPWTVDVSVSMTITFSADFDPFRRGCESSHCPCDNCPPGSLTTHPHWAGFTNDFITERFIGHKWHGTSYVACPCSSPFAYPVTPPPTSNDPFLLASPTFWLSTHSSPFYAVHSYCDRYFSHEELKWITDAAFPAGPALWVDQQPCDHGFGIYTPAGTAVEVDGAIQAHASCP